MVEALSGKYLLRHPHTARLGTVPVPLLWRRVWPSGWRTLPEEHDHQELLQELLQPQLSTHCGWTLHMEHSGISSLAAWHGLSSTAQLGFVPALKSEAIPYAYSSPRGWIHRRPPVSGLEAGDASLRLRLDPRLLSSSFIVCVLFTFYTSVSLSLKTRGVG